MYINQVAVTKNRMFLFTLADEHTLLQWNTETDMILRNYSRLNTEVSIKKFCIGKRSIYLFTFDDEGRLKSWD